MAGELDAIENLGNEPVRGFETLDSANQREPDEPGHFF